MKHLSKFAVIGTILLGMAGTAAAQSQGTWEDNSGNRATGGSGNQMPDSQQKNTQGGQGG